MSRGDLFLKGNADKTGKKVFNGLLVTLCVVIFLLITMQRLGLTLQLDRVWEFRTRFARGFFMTIVISVFSLLASLTLGTLAALGLRSRVLFLTYLARTYVEFIRGTPLLVQIYLFFYIIGTAWGVDNRYVAGVIILSVFEGA